MLGECDVRNVRNVVAASSQSLSWLFMYPRQCILCKINGLWHNVCIWAKYPTLSRTDMHVCAPSIHRPPDAHHMAKADTKTSIDSDGLRYRSKTPGSPFTAAGAFGAATMSCFLCGKHRPRSQLKSRRLLGKAQFVCSPSCKEADAEVSAKP